MKFAVKLLADLRAKGVSADMDYTGRSLKAQMKLADKLGTKYAMILGDDEVKSGVATVKYMAAHGQIPAISSGVRALWENCRSFLKSRIKVSEPGKA